MFTPGLIKIIGLIATVVGMGASIASGWAADKKMNLKINEEVAKAIAKMKE